MEIPITSRGLLAAASKRAVVLENNERTKVTEPENAPGGGNQLSFVSSIPSIVLCAVFAVTGLAKLLDLELFRSTLETWTIVPAWARPVILVGIPFFEIVLATCLGCWGRSRPVLLLAFLFIASMAAAYVIQYSVMGAPSCGCLGTLAKYTQASEGAKFVIGRNLFLLAVTVWGIKTARPQRRGLDVVGFPFAAKPRNTSAFTLIELLICICIVGVVISLTLPSLRFSVGAARHASRMAKLSTHAKALALYQADFRDSCPFFTLINGYTRLKVGRIQINGVFFDSKWMWYAVLGERYYSDSFSTEPFVGPGKRPATIPLDFWYSATLTSRPAFWNQLTRIGPSQWSAVQAHEVRFPSLKGVFTNHGEFADDESRQPVKFAMSMADGSVFSVGDGSEIAPYPFGEGLWSGATLDYGYLGIHTVDGVEGRDVIRR